MRTVVINLDEVMCEVVKRRCAGGEGREFKSKAHPWQMVLQDGTKEGATEGPEFTI